MDWTNIILATITLLGGCGWLIDRRRYRQQVRSLEADNRKKDLDLSRDYVEHFKANIVEPLQKEVRGLRRDVKNLREAIKRINDCPHSADCPVYDELQRQQAESNPEN